MDADLRSKVRERAGNRCEYCHLPAAFEPRLAFQIEHIVARQHRGTSDFDNLAFACRRCNLHKGPNLAGYDPDSADIIRLFHPRRDLWSDHFQFEGPYIRAKTVIGRTTIWVLQMNAEIRIRARKAILDERGTLD